MNTKPIKNYNLENISLMAKELASGKKLKVLKVDFSKEKIQAVDRDNEIKEYSFDDLRILQYTRIRDCVGRKIYEGSCVCLTRGNTSSTGIVICKRGIWGVMNYKNNKFTKILFSDKLRKIIKK